MRLKACLLWLAVSLSPASADEPITINATSLPVFDRSVPSNRFGPLTYLGGLALTSRHRDFEALSGLTMNGDRLIMVTDEGDWITATLQSQTDGTPTGITDARIGYLLNTDGTPMQSKRLADAEAVTLVGDELWVANERNQPIRAYDFRDGAFVGPARLPLGSSPPLQSSRNAGPEAMVHVTAGPLSGQTILFLEEPLRRTPLDNAARIRPGGERTLFQIRRMDRFAITGAATLPDGDLVIVERRFSWDDGIFMRLRWLPAEEIASGAVEGRTLLDADGGTIIDNMEGIAVNDHPDGPILTLISDDNGNFFQRTILLRFQITGDLNDLPALTPPSPTPRPLARPDL
ncbi:MAG: esterase-like activity of phytase family protein [Hyphomicrobiales bacterium]